MCWHDTVSHVKPSIGMVWEDKGPKVADVSKVGRFFRMPGKYSSYGIAAW
jgi:hypothetical protein